MASLILHQIIGENFCKSNNINSQLELLKGNIAPDISPNKEASHFKAPRPFIKYIDAIEKRVDLSSYCKNNKICTDYDLGYFLHLVTDYIFYNRLIINNTKFEDFCHADYPASSQKMYKEYERIAHFVLSVFPQTDVSQLPIYTTVTLDEDLTLFTEIELLNFINICSNINLQQLYNDISNNDYSTLNNIKI